LISFSTLRDIYYASTFSQLVIYQKKEWNNELNQFQDPSVCCFNFWVNQKIHNFLGLFYGFDDENNEPINPNLIYFCVFIKTN